MAEDRSGVGVFHRRGLPSNLRKDLYFHLMEGSWWRLIGVTVLAYVLLNLIFAGLYTLRPGSILNAEEGSYLDAFWFSVQTMSTIGYGGMAPGSPYGHLLVTVEAFVGLLGVALATGLIFAKVSRPSSSVLFAHDLVITRFHGRPTLMFRVGNARGNEVVEARATLSVLLQETSPEGHSMRRIYSLPLVRESSPVFLATWTVMHTIDEDSPLHGVDWQSVVLFIAILVGYDGTYATQTHARQTWTADRVRIGHRFVDVSTQRPDGSLVIDYTRFHDTSPDGS